MWLPAASDAVQPAVPVVSSGPRSATASGPQSVVAPSLKVTVALRMSPAALSPLAGTTELSRTTARRFTLADEAPPAGKTSSSPV